jgi:hypothetical protein
MAGESVELRIFGGNGNEFYGLNMLDQLVPKIICDTKKELKEA